MKRKILLPVAVLLVALAVAGTVWFLTTDQNPLLGLWSVDGVTKYRFEQDSRGDLVLPTADYPFTYTIEDGVIHIDFKNDTLTDASYEFILDGDTLTLDDCASTAQYTLTRDSE